MEGLHGREEVALLTWAFVRGVLVAGSEEWVPAIFWRQTVVFGVGERGDQVGLGKFSRDARKLGSKSSESDVVPGNSSILIVIECAYPVVDRILERNITSANLL